MRIVRLLVTLLLLALLAAAYISLALEWSYSSGERAGWVQKFSRKGWVCKSWEGELALVSLPGSTVEKFYFTVHNAAVAQEIQAAVGKRVTLHYEEKVGLPTSCFGDTRYFVDKVTATADIPLGPGVVVPTPASQAPASAGAAPPATPAMPAASAASPASPPSR
jgi:hypothetical protein